MQRPMYGYMRITRGGIMSVDRSRETDVLPDDFALSGLRRRALAALAVRLDVHGLTTALTSAGLRVSSPDAPGCCPDKPFSCDLITCKAFPPNGGWLWFFTSAADPISPARHVTETVTYLRDRLAPPPDAFGSKRMLAR